MFYFSTNYLQDTSSVKIAYSSVPNRRACTFISGKVCLLTSIEDKRQTLPEISMHIQNNAAIGILL